MLEKLNIKQATQMINNYNRYRLGCIITLVSLAGFGIIIEILSGADVIMMGEQTEDYAVIVSYIMFGTALVCIIMMSLYYSKLFSPRLEKREASDKAIET